jgi:CAAX prenyl protease-like protein
MAPIMEELFWRSFLARYIISADFIRIEVGRFTPASFFLSALLFGLEHNLWLAGIMAGIGFNLVLYRTRSIAQCILSHAVANLLLGIYVLRSGQWQFW